MFKVKFLIGIAIVLLTLGFSAGQAFSTLPDNPQGYALPIYWVSGAVTSPDAAGLQQPVSNPKIYLFKTSPTQSVEVNGDAAGLFTFNAYDLHYLFNEDITLGSTCHLLVPPKGPDKLGTLESVVLSPDNGFIIKNLILVAGGGQLPQTTLSGTITNPVTKSLITTPTPSVKVGDLLAAVAEGKYNLTLDPGTYSITASAVGYDTATYSGVNVLVGLPNVWDIFLIPNKDPTIYGSLAGKVVDENKQPLSGVSVSIAGKNPSTTGSDGLYSIGEITAETYQVKVTKLGTNTTLLFDAVVIKAGFTTELNITWPTETPPDGKAIIKGVVSAADTGVALSDASVLIKSAATEQLKTSDLTGAYQSDQLDPNITYTMTCSKLPDYAEVIKTVTPEANQIYYLNFQLSGGLPPLQIATSSLPDGTENASYQATLTAEGGTAPYTWTIEGTSLPNNLSLLSNGSITGTPASNTAGSYSITFKVTDSQQASTTKALDLKINGPAGPASLDYLSPTGGLRGATLDVVIFGQNVNWGSNTNLSTSTVNFGQGIDINSVTGNGANLIANITIKKTATLGDHTVTVTNVSGSLTFTVFDSETAILQALSPQEGQLGETLNLTITGVNTNWSGNMINSLHISGEGITVNSATAQNTSTLLANVTISAEPTTPLGARMVTVDNVSGALYFNVKAPTDKVAELVAISPNAGLQGETLDIIITGKNVSWNGTLSNDTVSFTGGDITVKSVLGLGSSLVANISLGAAAADTDRTVSVKNVSGTLTFKINAAGAPTLTNLSPNSAPAGSTLDVTIYGENVSWVGDMKSSLQFVGGNITVNSATGNGSSLSANIALDQNASGARTVVVNNVNNTLTFTIDPVLTPLLKSVSPTEGSQGATDLELTITGINTLWSGDMLSKLNITGSGITKKSAQATSNTTITAKIDIAADAPANLRTLAIAGINNTISFLVNEGVPSGTVKLNITRDGTNIKLTWDSQAAPDVYYSPVMTDEVTSWTKITSGGDFTVNPASIIHANAAQEVYYRALVAGNAPTELPKAWAVGKVDVNLHTGWNSISSPFTGQQFGGASGIVGDNFGEGDTANFWDYNQDGSQDMTAYKRFSVADGWNNPTVNLSLGQGCMFNISSLQGDATRTITLIGEVSHSDFSKVIRPKWNDIGNPVARELVSGGFFSSSVLPPANLAVGDTISSWGTTDFDATIRYLGNDKWEGNLVFKPGVGYWFNHVSTADKFNWNVKK